jgi:DNA repair photolyase
MTPETRGTKEWAATNINIFKGCSNDCRYCYAKKMAIRYGRISNAEEWHTMEPQSKSQLREYGKRNGIIMFPSTHDIPDVPEYVEACKMVIAKLLKAGNHVLIVSKPRLNPIRILCDSFLSYKSQLEFRFTITSMFDDKLRFWEPGASSFNERYTALLLVHNSGFQTSVSMEPMLDFNPIPLVRGIQALCSEIWIGCMNHITWNDWNGLLPEDQHFYNQIKEINSPEHLRDVFNQLKDFPQIRWKDSFFHHMNKSKGRT